MIDFSRSDAPTLGDDVEVVRRPRPSPQAEQAAVAQAESAPAAVAPAARQVALDLRVGMGEHLRIRGHGLDASLRGELRLTLPAGRLAVDGTLRVVDGTYQAYGQKLDIDRGILTFVGPVENPRLDIEATRPNLDVRVGVRRHRNSAHAAHAPVLRSRDERTSTSSAGSSLGRASEGVGADTALLQSAALALCSRAKDPARATDSSSRSASTTSACARHRASQGDVKETIVSLGKQISKRWYIGYERGLNATTGSWQLIYRIAQRLTVRAQAGEDNSIDLNWTLRWK